MIKVWPSIDSVVSKFVDAVRTFPATVFMSALAFEQSMYLLEYGGKIEEHSLIFSAFLGVPLMFAIESMIKIRGFKDIKSRSIGWLVGLSLLGLHYLYISDDISQNYWIRYIHTLLIVHLIVAILPFLNLKAEKSFWNYNKILILTFLEAGLYSAVLYAGLVIAVLTVKGLFGIFVPKNLYIWLLYFCGIIFHTTVFLAKANGRIERVAEEYKYPIGLQYFVQYMLIPLVTLYTVILYFYMGKIVLSLVWPEGYVGWLVTAVSVTGVLNLLLLDPLRESKKWIATYTKAYYLALGPLLIMLFLAIYQRIAAYGFTELRYLLVVLGLVLFSLIFYFLFSKTKNIKVIPWVLAGTLIVSLFGPMSAYEVSRRSQLNQLVDLLTEHGIIENGKVRESDDAEIKEGVAMRITDITQYLVKNHDLHHLESLFPKTVLSEVERDPYASTRYTRKKLYRRPKPLLDFMGVKYTTKYAAQMVENRSFQYNLPGEDYILNTKGFSRVYPFEMSTWEKTNSIGRDPDKIEARLREGAVELVVEGYKYKTSLKLQSMLTNLEKMKSTDASEYTQSAFTTDFNEKCQCQAVFFLIGGHIDKDQHMPERARGYILVK